MRVFIVDEDGLGDGLAARVFGAVDEAEEVAIVEIAEAVDFVGWGHGGGDAGDELGGELEAHVHIAGADVEEQVGGGGDGVARGGVDFAEGMELGGAGRAEEVVPGVGAERHDAGELHVHVA
jgi:hypothetical protein